MGIEAIGGAVMSAGPAIGGGIGAGLEGGLGGAALASGPSINFGGPSFEAAPFEPSFGSVIEGPVRGGLEGFSKMNIFDIGKPNKGGVTESVGSINFAPEPLNAAAAISAAESIIAETRINPAPSGVTQPEQFQDATLGVEPQIVIPNTFTPFSASEVRNLPTESVIPAWEIAAEPIPVEAIIATSQSQTEPVFGQATAAETAKAVGANQSSDSNPPLYQEQIIEIIVKEQPQPVQEKREEEDPETKEREDTEELTVKYVEDDVVSSIRKHQLGQAIDQAGQAAEENGSEQIAGSLLKQFFVPEDSNNRSPIAKPEIGDGGLEKTYEVVSTRDYSSIEEAKKAAEAAVDNFKPVKKSKGWGRLVKAIHVALARKSKIQPAVEMVTRIVKITKTVEAKVGPVKTEVTTAVKKEEFAEGRIEDQPDLAAVFQKAA